VTSASTPTSPPKLSGLSIAVRWAENSLLLGVLAGLTLLPLIEIAERVGYGSEAAFSRAFKRQFDVTPGEVRRHAH